MTGKFQKMIDAIAHPAPAYVDTPPPAPRRRGRPPLPAGERASARTALRCTASELDAYRAAAEAEGLTLSLWLRRVASLAAAASPDDPG